MFSSRRALACAFSVIAVSASSVAAGDVPVVQPASNCVGGHCGVGHGQRCAENKAICRDVKACCKTPAILLPPLGTYTRNAFELQRQNALGEYFTVYYEDFLLGTATLNDTGLRHLGGIARRIHETGAPVKVEPAGAKLDDKRKQAVVDALIRMGVDPQSAVARVVIGNTRAEGMRYDEVDRNGQRVIVGPGLGTLGGGIGGFGGAFR